MRMLKTILAASILSGCVAMAASDAQAMPLPSFTPTASGQGAVQDVYYRYYPAYGWHRPFYGRPYGYGWRRPYGFRGYGPGYYRGWHNRPLLGSRAR